LSETYIRQLVAESTKNGANDKAAVGGYRPRKRRVRQVLRHSL